MSRSYLRSLPPLPSMRRPEDTKGWSLAEKVDASYAALFAQNEHFGALLAWLEGRVLSAESKAEEATRQAQRVSLAMTAAPGLPNVEITGSFLLDQVEREQIIREAKRRDSWVRFLKRESTRFALGAIAGAALSRLPELIVFLTHHL